MRSDYDGLLMLNMDTKINTVASLEAEFGILYQPESHVGLGFSQKSLSLTTGVRLIQPS